MKIRIGGEYLTRDGRKACVKDKDACVWHGRIYAEDGTSRGDSWWASGHCRSNSYSPEDLVAEWKAPASSGLEAPVAELNARLSERTAAFVDREALLMRLLRSQCIETGGCYYLRTFNAECPTPNDAIAKALNCLKEHDARA